MKTSNELLSETIQSVDQLIVYAKADIENSQELNIPSQAADDRTRARKLSQCRKILEECYKPGVKG